MEIGLPEQSKTGAQHRLRDIIQDKRDKDSKICIHADSSCSKSIIQSHSISNRRVLDLLSVDGHLKAMVKPNYVHFDMKMTTVGRNIATSFPGLCQKHDSTIFKPIDEQDYILGNREMEYLYGYRGFAREYCSSRRVANGLNYLLKELNNKDSEIYSLSSHYFRECNPSIDVDAYLDSLRPGWRAHIKYFDGLESERVAFNSNLDNRRYYKLLSEVIVFEGEYGVAASSAMKIGNTRDHNMWKRRFITIFPQTGRTYVIVSSYHNAKGILNTWKKLKEIPLEYQKVYISNFIVRLTENFVLSPRVWDRISKEEQYAINDDFFRHMIKRELNPRNLSKYNLFI